MTVHTHQPTNPPGHNGSLQEPQLSTTTKHNIISNNNVKHNNNIINNNIKNSNGSLKDHYMNFYFPQRNMI